MPGRRRKPAEIARHRRKEADLYLKGWLQVDIADELGINQATVSRDLKALHKDWLASALIDFDRAKARELAKVARLEREYWAAWERSCEDAETVRQEANRDSGTGKVVRTRKGQAGDPRFLLGVQWCIGKRCEILGVDAPTKIEHTGKDRGPFEFKISLTDAERLAALAALGGRLPEDAD